MNFMRYRLFFLGFSACVLLLCVMSLVRFGLRPSIDFTGGSLLELRATGSTASRVFEREALQQLVGSVSQITAVQSSGIDQYIIRMEAATQQEKAAILDALSSQDIAVTELRFESVGPVLGRELFEKTLLAGVIVVLAISLYIWKQFHSVKYGVCAVLAMLHDSLILLGAFSIFGAVFGAEVDVLFVTALLTTLSFSIHDTIVVFDRIRENLRKHAGIPFDEIANASVLQTLSRSINNSMTIIIMLIALVLLGGEAIRWFAVALLVGAVTGTYSSTFTAVPLVSLWERMSVRARESK